MSSDADYAEKAKELLARGLHAFPLDHPDHPDCIGAHSAAYPCDGERGKHPTVKWGTWAVTVTPQMIDLAWSKHNGLCNIGVACGPSGIVGFDEDGARELRRWCADHGFVLPETYTVPTGRGRHHLYRWDHAANGRIGNTPKAVLNYKLDIRGDGGYLVGEGSLHASRVFYGDGDTHPIVDLPQEVADFLLTLQPKAQQPKAAAGAATVPPQAAAGGTFWQQVPTGDPNRDMIPDGERHNALMAYAGHLRNMGADQHEAEALFRLRWLLCEQPDGQIPEAQFHTATCRFAVEWDDALNNKLGYVYNNYTAGTGRPQAGGAQAGGGSAPDLDDAHIAPHIADGWLRDRFLMTGEFGWLEYDGRRWTAVPEAAVGEAVRLAVIDMHAAEAQAGATAKRLGAISALFSAHKIFSIVRLSKGYLRVEGIEFDAHPDLLNCANGVVNLRDGSLMPHDPGLRFTKLCPTNYVKGATHPDWDKAQEALPDAETVDYLQIRFGQGLTGYPAPDDVLLFLRGSGENAKTTWVLVIRMAVGSDYAVKLSDRVLLANKGDHPTELMELRGARLAIAEELPDAHLNLKRLKDTQGDGGMSARYCGKDTMKWEQTHTMFATTNPYPGVDDPDHAVWRRLEMVEFPYRYRKPHQALEGPLDRRGDGRLRPRLKRGKKQHEAVLAWLVEGAVRWYQGGEVMPEPPAAVVAAKEAWRGASDLLLQYAADHLVPAKDYHVMSVDLFDDFSEWLRAKKNTPWSDKTLSARLESHSRLKDKGVSKKRLTASAKNQTLSRPNSRAGFWGGGYALGKVPDKYVAWVGLKFRAPSDPPGSGGINGW